MLTLYQLVGNSLPYWHQYLRCLSDAPKYEHEFQDLVLVFMMSSWRQSLYAWEWYPAAQVSFAHDLPVLNNPRRNQRIIRLLKRRWVWCVDLRTQCLCFDPSLFISLRSVLLVRPQCQLAIRSDRFVLNFCRSSILLSLGKENLKGL